MWIQRSGATARRDCRHLASEKKDDEALMRRDAKLAQELYDRDLAHAIQNATGEEDDDGGGGGFLPTMHSEPETAEMYHGRMITDVDDEVGGGFLPGNPDQDMKPPARKNIKDGQGEYGGGGFLASTVSQESPNPTAKIPIAGFEGHDEDGGGFLPATTTTSHFYI